MRALFYLQVILLLCITSCGGSDSNSNTGTPTDTNTPPIANAGTDQTSTVNTLISLNASASSDSDGSISNYAWSQTSGTTVELSSTSVNAPTFTSPSVNENETLVFQLTVTDNQGATASDSISITITATVTGVSFEDAGLNEVLLLNELSFELDQLIGKKVWAVGYFGSRTLGTDTLGILIENMFLLEVDEEYPHHSHTMLTGVMPSSDWHGNQVLVYGEVKNYQDETGDITENPIPLIVVEEFKLISAAEAQENIWENTYLLPSEDDAAAKITHSQGKNSLLYDKAQIETLPFNRLNTAAPGVKAQDCDRALILSGGVNDKVNYPRYKNNIIAKFNKMKSLGFTDEQISVFYNNGTPVEIDEGSEKKNITDFPTTKAGLTAYFQGLAQLMQGSCTLTIFVTDHGTGFNPSKPYGGARPAKAQANKSATKFVMADETTDGVTYDENKMTFDARKKKYKETVTYEIGGELYRFRLNKNDRLDVYKRIGNRWTKVGSNDNGDDVISEVEMGGLDINEDGDATDADWGYTVSELKERLVDKYYTNLWDSDRDGTLDVRLRWDGERYLAEQLIDDGTWKEMGRDTNGDLIIDMVDGGIDWNLDGDKNDKVAFHEGINLWGRDVLWDDEFADMLKPLSDMGIHIMVEMVSCYSGGFVPNLEGIVENIYVGASEETPHINRAAAGGGYYAADEIEFLNKLDGIDTDSWNTAAAAATAEDDRVATEQGRTKNIHVHGQTTRFPTNTIFQAGSNAGEYTIQLDLPDDIADQIYDFEFIFGLQNPRWSNITFPDGIPSGLQSELAPGGIRLFSTSPIPEGQQIKINVEGAMVDNNMRIEFTDINHKRLGYTVASAGSINVPTNNTIAVASPAFCVNHTDHGQSSPSVIEWLFAMTLWAGADPADVQVTLQIITPSGFQNVTLPLNQVGQLYVLFEIFTFGNYSFSVTGAVYTPTGEGITLTGETTGSYTVDSSETNKGQCSPSN